MDHDDARQPVDQVKRAAALSGLLDELWDPLGVYSSDLAENWPPGEYSKYAPGLLALLDRGATPAEVAWHLRDVAHQQMDLPPSGNESQVADLLIRWHALWSA